MLKYIEFMFTSSQALLIAGLLLLGTALLTLLFAYLGYRNIGGIGLMAFGLLLVIIIVFALSYAPVGPVIDKWEADGHGYNTTMVTMTNGVILMLLGGLTVGIVTIAFNWLMRRSQENKPLTLNERRKFLTSNSSWLLMRVSAFYIAVGLGLFGFVLDQFIFPGSGNVPMPQLIFFILIPIAFFCLAVWLMLKISRMNQLASKWK